MPFFLGHQCWHVLDDKTPFPGAKGALTRCVHAGLFCFFFFFFFFEILKKCNPDVPNVLSSDKI